MIVVAYPTQEHAQLTLAALAAGKDVICEKPLAWSADETRAVIRAAHQSNRHLAVCHIRRYWAPCVRMKEIALQIGTIRRVSWSYRVRQHWPADWRSAAPGGYLLDAHVHELDLLRWWLGRTPRTVWATGRNSADGAGVLVFRTQEGDQILFDWDGDTYGHAYPQGAEHHAEALGERGRARLTISDATVAVDYIWDGMQEYAHEEWSIGDVVAGSWPAMWSAFTRYLTLGEEPVVSVVDAAIAVDMTLAAVQSIDAGSEVALPVVMDVVS